MDWMMPEMDGVEVARRIRRLDRGKSRPYLIILTSMDDIEKLVTALEAGADDYITKPFNPPELKARVQVGQRILKLQDDLAQRVGELEIALSRVKTSAGSAAHLFLLQEGAQRRQLLATGGELCQRTQRGHLQPLHLPRLLQGICRAPAERAEGAAGQPEVARSPRTDPRKLKWFHYLR